MKKLIAILFIARLLGGVQCASAGAIHLKPKIGHLPAIPPHEIKNATPYQVTVEITCYCPEKDNQIFGAPEDCPGMEKKDSPFKQFYSFTLEPNQTRRVTFPEVWIRDEGGCTLKPALQVILGGPGEEHYAIANVKSPNRDYTFFYQNGILTIQ